MESTSLKCTTESLLDPRDWNVKHAATSFISASPVSKQDFTNHASPTTSANESEDAVQQENNIGCLSTESSRLNLGLFYKEPSRIGNKRFPQRVIFGVPKHCEDYGNRCTSPSIRAALIIVLSFFSFFLNYK